MKRLVDADEPTLRAVTQLVASAERHEPDPFAKRRIQSRVMRAVEGRQRRFAPRPIWLGVAGLFIAASATAAAGYALFTDSPGRTGSASTVFAPMPPSAAVRDLPPAREPLVPEVAPSADNRVERRVDKPRPGEDPSQVAEAVRALRKQGDPGRALQLLDRYLRSNPRGALAEDALALSIEAAAARKDPRASDYARRYLARYPRGRFRAMAERVLAR
jgi:hypothetical protein